MGESMRSCLFVTHVRACQAKKRRRRGGEGGSAPPGRAYRGGGRGQSHTGICACFYLFTCALKSRTIIRSAFHAAGLGGTFRPGTRPHSAPAPPSSSSSSSSSSSGEAASPPRRIRAPTRRRRGGAPARCCRTRICGRRRRCVFIIQHLTTWGVELRKTPVIIQIHSRPDGGRRTAYHPHPAGQMKDGRGDAPRGDPRDGDRAVEDELRLVHLAHDVALDHEGHPQLVHIRLPQHGQLFCVRGLCVSGRRRINNAFIRARRRQEPPTTHHPCFTHLVRSFMHADDKSHPPPIILVVLRTWSKTEHPVSSPWIRMVMEPSSRCSL